MPDTKIMDNPYTALGVPVDASHSLIDHAFREASYACHPDRYPGDGAREECYKYLAHCRDQLKDSEARKKIDSELQLNGAIGRQKQRELKRDQMIRQAAAERQAERAAAHPEPSFVGIQRQGAIRGLPAFRRQGPLPDRRSLSQKVQENSEPSTISSKMHVPPRYQSRSARPVCRPPAANEDPVPLVDPSNAIRQAPKRPPLLHDVPAELYEQQARMRNAVQQSWMPGDDGACKRDR